MQLQGATVLLTGATGGLGGAAARALAARGATLVLTGRQADVLEQLAQELPGGNHQTVVCDLTDRSDLKRLVDEAGDVDVLVANAGVPATGDLDSFSEEELDRIVEANLTAPVQLAHALLPGMTSRRRGHLVFLSSLSGKVASPSASMYAATKFGLRGFALGLRQDVARQGVGVSVVSPGFIRDAGMFAKSGAEDALPPGVGTMTPEDVADAVVKAVERNRAEIVVAPAGLRVGTAFGMVFPSASAFVQRATGGHKIARRVGEGQQSYRV